jgi:RNA polymerase sigma-70 factor (ECF subfamily)
VSVEIDIQALQRGDVHAFEVLVLSYEKKVLNMCWYILQNKEEAEDATQDVFITIYQSIHKFKGEAKLSTWIHRITLNKCLENIRRAKRKKRFGIHQRIDTDFMDHTIDLEKNPAQVLMEKERTKAFLTAVQHLPENQRIAYTLHHMEEFSYKEISESMSLSLSAIESLIFRAKQQLKRQLEASVKNNWI